MDVDEVKDRDSLRQYRDALPAKDWRDVALRVAFNNAARVFPIAADLFLTSDWARKRKLTPVAVFGSLAISAVALKMPTADIGSAIYTPNAVSNAVAAAYVAAAANAAFSSSAVAANANADAKTANAAANAAAAAASAAFSSSAVATNAAANAAAYAATTANAAAAAGIDLWDLIRRDLTADAGVWPEGMPDGIRQSWQNALDAMQDHAADWSIWIHWYNRILDGRDWHPQAMWNVLQDITREDWNKGPEHINPMFDEVLALYFEEDGVGATSGERQERSANHVKTVRTQVFALQEFLEAEYLNLAGHNARSPEQDEMLELLRVLKDLVVEMIQRLEGTCDDETALTVVRNTLPAVVEQAGELALVEAQPLITPTVATMSATIKSLVDAGADPELATKYAMGEAAGRKIWPRIKGLFGRS